MLKVMIALFGLTAFAGAAQANETRMLERLECRGEISRSGELRLGVTSWLRDDDGDMDRDYDVIRCRMEGMTRGGTHMFSCNHPYINSARITPNSRGFAMFNVNYGNMRRGLRGATHGCAISGSYQHRHNRNCGHNQDQGDVEQGPEQGPEQGQEQGPEQGRKTPMK